MFAALMVARLSEAVSAVEGLRTTKSWVSPDSVPATELPLAKATVKVLSSMHSVLERTLETRDAELAVAVPAQEGEATAEELEKRAYLRKTKAAEVRLVRNTHFLRDPKIQFEVQDWKKEDLPEDLR